MIHLQEKDVKALLEILSDPKIKKEVERYLSELQKPTIDLSKPVESSLKQKRLAKKALDLIIRVVIELIKHKTCGDFLDYLD